MRGLLAAARFPSPLSKPDVPFSSIRLSDRIHHQLTEGLATKRRSTPSFPNTTRSEYLAVPSEGTLWRRLRNVNHKGKPPGECERLAAAGHQGAHSAHLAANAVLFKRA